MWIVGAILAGEAVPRNVSQHCFQALARAARDAGLLVRDQTYQLLPFALSHNARLVMIDPKALLQRDRCDQQETESARVGAVYPRFPIQAPQSPARAAPG